MRTVTAEELAALPTKLNAGTAPQHGPSNPLASYRLAEEINAADIDLSDLLTGARAMLAAITETPSASARIAASPSLLTLTAAETEALVRETALDLAVTAQGSNAPYQLLTNRFGQDFDAAFRDKANAIVEAMRPRWDTAVAAVVEANDAGLTSTTNQTEMLSIGTSEQITAYRTLGPAVATLDKLAGVRIKMCNTAGVGPAEHPITCLLDAAPGIDLESAANIYDGRTEVAFLTVMNATAPHHVPIPRLGGAWLELIAAGYRLRLNTAAEAEAVLTASRVDTQEAK